MPTVTDQMLADQQQDIHDTLARITEQARRLRASHDRLLAALKDIAKQRTAAESYSEGAYEYMVRVARTAITAASEFTE